MTMSTAVHAPGGLFDLSNSDYFTDLATGIDVDLDRPAWPDEFGTKLRDWSDRHVSHKPTTLSLFSGAGGLDIGFHDAGFQVLEMVELEKQFAATLCANAVPGGYFGPGVVHCIDIRDFSPSRCLKVDFVIGGPPCQSFSAAGRRASGVTGINDARGTLFEEYVRILTCLKPKGFLFENVYGITGANDGAAWREIQTRFANAGYRIASRVLDAADFGVPQHRERMFIVGTRSAPFRFPRPTHGPDSAGSRGYYAAELAVTDAPGPVPPFGIKGRYGDLLPEIPAGLNYSFFTEKLGHPRPLFAWRSKFSDFLYKADPRVPVRTIKAQGGQYTGPFHWDSRPFSIGELKRLQTFPDNYTITGGRQKVVHQIGNSVPPQLARCLAMAILHQVFGIQLPAEISYLATGEQLGFRTRKRFLTKIYSDKAVAALGAERQPTDTAQSRRAGRHSHTRTLGLDDFSWRDNRARSGGAAIKYKCTLQLGPRQWSVRIAEDASNDRFACQVRVVHSDRTTPWNLPTESILLVVSASNSLGLTAAWKCLEEHLASQRFRADIVQLIGYFQYSPAIRCEWDSDNASHGKLASLLKRVTEGYGVRRTLSVSELAAEWAIPIDSVADGCITLRRLGFEVRNRNTNPEMPQGHYLVPYPFPTLTPKSVQLRKTLTFPGASRGWRL